MKHNAVDFDVNQGTAGQLPVTIRKHPQIFDIRLIAKDKTVRDARVRTLGNIPKVVRYGAKTFEINIALGEPYLYLEIYAEDLSNIEVHDS